MRLQIRLDRPLTQDERIKIGAMLHVGTRCSPVNYPTGDQSIIEFGKLQERAVLKALSDLNVSHKDPVRVD